MWLRESAYQLWAWYQSSSLSDLILREAVALLDFALKLISSSINRDKVVISAVSPLLLDLAL